MDNLDYKLMESLRGNHCPVCDNVLRLTKSSMKSFLYECVRDRGVRTELRDARGLCPDHAFMLRDEGDPLAHAIVYHDILEESRKDMFDGNFEPYRYHSGCRWCREAREYEHDYVNAFLKCFEEPEFEAAYKKNGLVCMYHLGMLQDAAVQRKKSAVFEKIRDITAEKLDALLESLNEIRRKSDYRFTDEKWTDEEASAWKEAVEVTDERTGITREPAPKKNSFFRLPGSSRRQP